MLDLAYLKADKYLDSLATKSGGRLLRADTLASLPDAFSQIAAELRTQYMLGYYPIKKERDERYRTIKVTTARKDVVIRARPGYLATAARRPGQFSASTQLNLTQRTATQCLPTGLTRVTKTTHA